MEEVVKKAIKKESQEKASDGNIEVTSTDAVQ